MVTNFAELESSLEPVHYIFISYKHYSKILAQDYHSQVTLSVRYLKASSDR